jgi:predicted nucleic acid-binding protein
MRHGKAVFVDSGAWIALALSRDPLHPQAREQWNLLHKQARSFTPPFPLSWRHSHFSIATPTGTWR